MKRISRIVAREWLYVVGCFAFAVAFVVLGRIVLPDATRAKYPSTGFLILGAWIWTYLLLLPIRLTIWALRAVKNPD